MIRLNERAPDFTARSTHGPIQLSSYKGRWVVLFSHPADFTPVCTSDATSGSPVGSYPIACSGGSNANYAPSYSDGTLTVTPRALHVSADSTTRTYGEPNPTFTASRHFVSPPI